MVKLELERFETQETLNSTKTSGWNVAANVPKQSWKFRPILSSILVQAASYLFSWLLLKFKFFKCYQKETIAA